MTCAIHFAIKNGANVYGTCLFVKEDQVPWLREDNHCFEFGHKRNKLKKFGETISQLELLEWICKPYQSLSCLEHGQRPFL